ncbi:hypothetical protein [Polaromonas sp.]|uniref:hypothetical protein n=1 Tax=Polaromonas sp. TaxID=1869339 RepID=UPI0037502ABE
MLLVSVCLCVATSGCASAYTDADGATYYLGLVRLSPMPAAQTLDTRIFSISSVGLRAGAGVSLGAHHELSVSMPPACRVVVFSQGNSKSTLSAKSITPEIKEGICVISQAE